MEIRDTRQTTLQRNAGIKAARGELIYFLDDDSTPPPGNLLRLAPHFADPKVQMVGGPNLCPPGAPALEKVFALVLSSRLAFGPSRARYKQVGQVRAASEKELILCNLAARRQTMLDLGGFNEAPIPTKKRLWMNCKSAAESPSTIRPHCHRLPAQPQSCKDADDLRTGRAEYCAYPTFGSALNLFRRCFVYT